MGWPDLQPLVDAGAFYIRVQAIDSLAVNAFCLLGAGLCGYAIYRFLRFIATPAKGKS